MVGAIPAFGQPNNLYDVGAKFVTNRVATVERKYCPTEKLSTRKTLRVQQRQLCRISRRVRDRLLSSFINRIIECMNYLAGRLLIYYLL